MRLQLLLIVFFPATLFSQQNTEKQAVEIQKNELNPNPPQTIQKSVDSTSATENNNVYPLTISSNNQAKPIRTIEQIDYQIQAIDSKMQYVSSDQTMKEKAEAEGWFMQMNAFKEALIQEKQSLTSK